MKKAVVYLRVSTKEQAKHGVSLAAQEERAKAYCEMAGLEIVYIAREEGVSASKPLNTRPEGKKLLEIVRREKIGHIVALKVDRLFRSTVDALNQTTKWDKAGISLHLIDIGGASVDTSSAIGRFFLSTMASFAELERNLISERTTMALEHKKETRKVYAGTPYGWDREGDELTPNQQEQEVIKTMVDWRAEGWSFRMIAKELNDRGVSTKHGKSWHPPGVRYIIANTNLHEYVM